MARGNNKSDSKLRVATEEGVAVLDEKSGQYIFPAAEKEVLDPSFAIKELEGMIERTKQLLAERPAWMEERHIKSNQEDLAKFEKELAELKSGTSKEGFKGAYSHYVMGKNQGTPERAKELDELRAKSMVKDIVWHGQKAIEELDNKKAAKAIAEKRKAGEIKKGAFEGYSGSAGDGLYHMALDPNYAAGYGDSKGVEKASAVVQGVILSKNLLDLSELSFKSGVWWANQEVNRAAREADRRETGPRIRHPFSKNPRPWDYASGIIDIIARQYQQKYGKPMPTDAGLDKHYKASQAEGSKNYYAEDFGADKDPYKWVKTQLAKEIDRGKGKEIWTTYHILKTNTFKRLFKDGDFDCVKYQDYGNGIHNGEPSYAVRDPQQFKSYAGGNKVNLKSKNMFDA